MIMLELMKQADASHKSIGWISENIRVTLLIQTSPVVYNSNAD